MARGTYDQDMDAATVDPRIEHTRRVVLQASVEVVAERGFSAATIDAIAQRSGVARSTIYRHWPDRMGLLLEAVRSQVNPTHLPEGRDTRSILIALVTHLAKVLGSEPVGSIAASLIAESRRDPQLNQLRERFFTQRIAETTQALQRASDRDELAATIELATIVNDLVAPIFFNALVMQAPVDAAWVEARVDQLLSASANG